MENIDDLMRNKFNEDEAETRFEFNEAYWEQAQALLEADEAKKRRKRRLLLFLPLLMLLLGVLLCNKGKLWPSESTTIDFQQENQSISRGQQGVYRNGNDLTSNSVTTNPANGAQPPAEVSATLHEASSPKPTNPSPNQSANLDPADLDKQQQKREGQRNNTEAGRIVAPDANAQVDNFKTGTEISGKTAEKGGKMTQPAVPLMPFADIKSDSSTTQVYLPETNRGIPEYLPFLKRELSPFLFGRSHLVLPEMLKSTPDVQKVDTKIHKDKKPLMVSVWGSGGIKTSSMENKEFDFNPKWTAALGLNKAWALRESWLLNTGLGLRYLPGAWETSDSTGPVGSASSTVLKYGFGLVESRQITETLGLLYAEVPLNVQYKWNKFSFGAGATPRFLLSVHNKETRFTEEPFEAPRSETHWFRRIDPVGYRKIHVIANAGVDYQINSALSIGLNAGWSARLPSLSQNGTRNYHFIEATLKYNLF